ncbi:MAG: 2-amino-4-hydroxy-6-hydroxymethyldihydropteridine diphosphokinase [Bryobacteraceae bacterium]
MPGRRVFLSLGSNLGDREQNLESALRLLEQQNIEIVRRSSLYETEPQDFASQPWFLNLAVECRAKYFPLQMLELVLEIERRLGRERHAREIPKGPRLIDIDILLYGRAVIDIPKLTVPHPGLLDRRFVLEPLVEIDRQLRHPVTGRLLRHHLLGLHGQIVRLYHN